MYSYLHIPICTHTSIRTYLSAHKDITICTYLSAHTYLVSAHRSTWIIIYKMLWSAQNFSAQTFYLSAQCTTYLLYLHLVQLKSEIWISRLRARNLKIQIVQIGFCFVQAFTMHQMQFFQGMFRRSQWAWQGHALFRYIAKTPER